MRVITGMFLSVLLVCAFHTSFAQTNFSAIKGVVFTNNTSPADGATVILLRSKDSSVVRSTISTTTGTFNFDKLQAGNYLVLVTKFNYNKYYLGPYQLTAGKTVDLGSIKLIQAANQLKEITIIGKKDLVEVSPDKTVLNVSQNIMAAGGSLYDVLTTSPGVKVVNDDILYRNGQKAMIAINGRPVLLTGEELVTFLKNYQSSSISQIELIDNPEAKYGSGAGGGMINIVLKRKLETGSNLIVTASGSYGQKYKSNFGLNYNLHTGGLNLFASYGFQDNQIDKTIFNNRNIRDAGQLYNFNLNYAASLRNVNNNFIAGADYQLSKGQKIGFLVNGFVNGITIDKFNSTVVSTNGVKDSTINTRSAIDRNINNVSYNLNYKADLDKLGNTVISANGDYSNYQRHSSEALENYFVDATGQPQGKPIIYQDNSPSHIIIKSANIDFRQALSKSAHLEAGVKSSGVSSDNEIDFEQKITGGYIPVTTLTDHFIYNERIDAAYIQFDSKFGNTNFIASLRDEKTTSSSQALNPGVDVITNTRNYNDLFPNIQLSQQLNKNNQLTIFYTRSVQRPNYQDLNPFIGYVDQFYYSTGNPYLKPEYINTFEASDFINHKYKLSAGLTVTNNYYNTIFTQDNVTRVYTNVKANLGTRYQYILQFNVPVDITNWWNINADVIGYHERYIYYGDTVANKTTNNFQASLNQNFKISSRLTLQLFNIYYSPSYYVISQYQSLTYMNAGLSYAVMQKKATVRLSVSDIFNSNYNRYQTNFANLDIYAKDKQGSRFVTATFTYHFGSSTIRNHNTPEEQKRLGGSSNEN